MINAIKSFAKRLFVQTFSFTLYLTQCKIKVCNISKSPRVIFLSSKYVMNYFGWTRPCSIEHVFKYILNLKPYNNVREKKNGWCLESK